MRAVHLHGSLGEKYGHRFDLQIETAAEAIRALSANFPGFERDIIEGSWHVVRGKDPDSGFDLGEQEIVEFRLGSGDLHIVPYVEGAKNRGALKVVLGVALIGLSFGFAAALATPISSALFGATTWGNAIGAIGFSLAIAGVSSLISPSDTDENSDEDKRSFVSSGPGNTEREGAIVPIVYGEVITGGVLISGGIDIEQIGV